MCLLELAERRLTPSKLRNDSRPLELRLTGKGSRKSQTARNEVEHYFPQLNQQALNGIVASAFSIIRDFVAEELEAEPRELLGEPTWKEMLTVAEVYEAERDVCSEAISVVNWPSDSVREGISDVVCSDCGSDLLRPGEQSDSFPYPLLLCRACGSSIAPEVFVPEALAAALAHEMYLHYTDGDVLPYTECPECFENAYLVEDQQCALCGHQAEHVCTICGNDIPPEVLGSSSCGSCGH